MRSLLALTLLLGAPLSAQTHDGGVYRIYQGGSEVGREVYTRVADTLTSEVLIPMLGARLAYRIVWDGNGHVARFEATVRAPESDSVRVRSVVVADGDSLRYRQVSGGNERAGAVDGPVDAVLGPQSVSGIAALVWRARGRDTTLHVWAPAAGANGMLDVPLAIAGDSATLTLANVPMTLHLAPDGTVDRLENPVQRVRVERSIGTDLPPLPGLTPPERDYSAPEGAPYTASEVRVPAGTDADTFSLAGTLLVPHAGTPPYPALITITGSGGQDRDENLYPLLPDYRPFREIADRMARAGFVVLRVDDRGVGESGGSMAEATMEDFANDLRAQVAWLRARDALVDPARIALLGHSEGGVVGPMVAADDPDIAAVVIMAGTAKPGVEVLKDQFLRPIETAPGLTPAQRDSLRTRALTDLMRDTTGNAWMRHFRTYDPRVTARRVTQPVLILQGALDRQVTAGQADTLAAAIRAGGNEDVTVRLFPRLNHMFLVAPGDGSPTEYTSIREQGLPDRVLAAIEEWLVARLKPPGRR